MTVLLALHSYVAESSSCVQFKVSQLVTCGTTSPSYILVISSEKMETGLAVVLSSTPYLYQVMEGSGMPIATHSKVIESPIVIVCVRFGVWLITIGDTEKYISCIVKTVSEL